MTTSAKKARKKQADCPHPSRHVHPTIDARYETCDLCHVIKRAPINPPWYTAYDEAQPVQQLQIFADYNGEEEGEKES